MYKEIECKEVNNMRSKNESCGNSSAESHAFPENLRIAPQENRNSDQIRVSKARIQERENCNSFVDNKNRLLGATTKLSVLCTRNA